VHPLLKCRVRAQVKPLKPRPQPGGELVRVAGDKPPENQNPVGEASPTAPGPYEVATSNQATWEQLRGFHSGDSPSASNR
jgi:hypothetical protein